MEDDAGQIAIVIAHHATQYRVGEFPQRRIRRDTAYSHIESLFGKLRGESTRFLFLEVAAVSDAAGDWKAPMLGLDRELGSSDDIPDNEWASDVRIGSVAAIVRQVQLRHGEVSCGAHVH